MHSYHTVDRHRHDPPRPRRGFVLLLSLLCLIAISLMLTGMLRCTLQARERMRLQQRRLQSAWLATAGVERARTQSLRNPDYHGETWEVPGWEGGTSELQSVTARVVIEVLPRLPRAHESPAPRWSVTAEYPLQENLRVRTTK